MAGLTGVRRAAARTRSPSARHAAVTPPRREARNELKPPTAFPIPASTVQLRHLRAAAVGDLHPDKPVPDPDRDRDRPARSPRPAMPDSSLTGRAASSPHGCSGPSTPPTNARATRARSARPATSAPAFPRPPLPPGNHRGRQAGCTGLHARLSGSRQAGTRDRRGPSVAVRETADGYPDRATGTNAVRLPASCGDCKWFGDGRKRDSAESAGI
jgi:hypothetical protein